MSVNTKIEWCDHTFNPWIGCAKVSPGCAHCYAETQTFARVRRARGQELWGKGAARVRTSAANWNQPKRWNQRSLICPNGAIPLRDAPGGHGPYSHDAKPGPCCECGAALRRSRVFCASMADWLDDAVPIEWLADLLKLIRETPNLDWLLLTKRPQNWANRVSQAMLHVDRFWINGDCGRSQLGNWIGGWLEGIAPQRGFSDIPSNIWIGTSVEDQQRADERIPEFLKIPARVRFLSVEPMLGPIDLRFSCFNGSDSFGTMPGIHWAIFGGESGPKARPCNIEWIRDGVRQCRAAGVAPFVKQLGADAYSDTACNCGRNSDGHWKGPAACYQCGGRLNLKEPKGGDMSEWPEDLRVREFPEVIR